MLHTGRDRLTKYTLFYYIWFDKYRKYDIFSNYCWLLLLESVIKLSFRKISSKMLLMFTEETQYNTICVWIFEFYNWKVPLKWYNFALESVIKSSSIKSSLLCMQQHAAICKRIHFAVLIGHVDISNISDFVVSCCWNWDCLVNRYCQISTQGSKATNTKLYRVSFVNHK